MKLQSELNQPSENKGPLDSTKAAWGAQIGGGSFYMNHCISEVQPYWDSLW